jgi:predicted DNA-binding protein with PD1-like motif
VSLQAGIPLELAVREALADQNIDSAWLTISGAPFQTLDYVIPDHAQDDQHVAWYSKTHHLADGFITRLGMIVGRYNGQSFIHGHGLWSDETTQDALGHILAPSTILTEPVVAKGIGLIGARFEREPDAETNFDLFHIQDFGAEVGDYAALRLAPNQDFTPAVEEAVADLGWSSANVLGIGSLVGASFQNGETLESLPTEFLITDAHVGPNAPTPEILIVGVDGKNVMSGRLKRGENAVLVTSELVLHRTG